MNGWTTLMAEVTACWAWWWVKLKACSSSMCRFKTSAYNVAKLQSVQLNVRPPKLVGRLNCDGLFFLCFRLSRMSCSALKWIRSCEQFLAVNSHSLHFCSVVMLCLERMWYLRWEAVADAKSHTRHLWSRIFRCVALMWICKYFKLF